MLAARRSLAALTALTALFAAAYAQTKCGSATSGSTNGTPIELKVFVMKPGQADFNVDVPNVCPAQSTIIGLTGVACDDDVPPLVVAYDTAHAHVHRQGSLETEGVIKTTVYCEPLSKPRARYGPQPKPYLKYGVQNAYEAMRPRVSRMLGPSNYDAPNVYSQYGASKAYDPTNYAAPEAREHAASLEQGARNGYEGARSYADIGLVDAPQPYAPYAPLAPVVVPLLQN